MIDIQQRATTALLDAVVHLVGHGVSRHAAVAFLVAGAARAASLLGDPDFARVLLLEQFIEACNDDVDEARCRLELALAHRGHFHAAIDARAEETGEAICSALRPTIVPAGDSDV